jgi:hypothetical protein
MRGDGTMTKSLRERCKEFYQRMGQNAMMRQGDPVDDLVAFVLAELGRRADDRLDDTLPLCLYFGSKADRDEFIALVRQAKPSMIMKEMP